ncbi:MAG TPA: TetR/AcrR family transcriptional regulator [Candidatus Dormibacteraeota bacterium]|nr:TetR/AcrR family transcriptional regulator [Candidatus Dormibacteraeota bacterium]
MIVSGQDGRLNQKRRTRRALIEAASNLVRAGQQPSVAEAAEAALVSKATAYRYFPTQHSLLLEVGFEAMHPSARSLLEGAAEDDPQARFETVLRAVHGYMTSEEALFRTMMKVNQERWLESADRAEPDPVVREGRRMEHIDAVIEPLRNELDSEALARLRCGLALVFGIEPIAILKDVCGLDSAEALEVLQWVGKTLIAASKTSPDVPVMHRRPIGDSARY